MCSLPQRLGGANASSRFIYLQTFRLAVSNHLLFIDAITVPTFVCFSFNFVFKFRIIIDFRDYTFFGIPYAFFGTYANCRFELCKLLLSCKHYDSNGNRPEEESSEFSAGNPLILSYYAVLAVYCTLNENITDRRTSAVYKSNWLPTQTVKPISIFVTILIHLFQIICLHSSRLGKTTNPNAYDRIRTGESATYEFHWMRRKINIFASKKKCFPLAKWNEMKNKNRTKYAFSLSRSRVHPGNWLLLI